MHINKETQKIEGFLSSYCSKLTLLGLNPSINSKGILSFSKRLIFLYLTLKRVSYVFLYPKQRILLFEERLMLEHRSKKIHTILLKDCEVESSREVIKLNRLSLLKFTFKSGCLFNLKPNSLFECESFSVFFVKFLIGVTLLSSRQLKGVISVDDLVPSKFAFLCASHFLNLEKHIVQMGDSEALLNFPWEVESIVCHTADQVRLARKLRLAKDYYQIQNSDGNSISFDLSFEKIRNIGVIANAFTSSDQIIECCKTLQGRFKEAKIYIQPHPGVIEDYKHSIYEFQVVNDLCSFGPDIIVTGNTSAVSKFYNMGLPLVYTNELENIHQLDYKDSKKVVAIDPNRIYCADDFTLTDIKDFYRNKSVDLSLHSKAHDVNVLCSKFFEQ